MKRFTAFILAMLTLISLLSCKAEKKIATTGNEQDTLEKEPQNNDYKYPEVSDVLTLEALEEIPVANQNMSEAELRQICLDYFHLQLTFAWTPSKTLKYTIVSSGNAATLYRGTVYGGLPYVTDSLGNLYRVFDFYDPETGIITPPSNMKDQDFAKIFGNQCSYGAYWAWSRVSNSLTYRYTNTINQSHGAIPVGPYSYDKDLNKFSEYTTKQICADNGKQVMYQSYAALKPADGLVYYTTAGHVIMCASEPTVVYNEDGTINGEKSYIKIMDQNGGFTTSSQSDGSEYEVQGGVYTKKTFAKLYSTSYLPFTLAEFQGSDPVEEAEYSLGLSEGKNTLKDIKDATLKTNYPISHLHVKIFDENGEEAYFFVSRTSEVNSYSYNMSGCIFPMSLEKYADGKHTLDISCFLGNGEKVSLFHDTVRK